MKSNLISLSLSLRLWLRAAAVAPTALACLPAQTARDVPRLIQELEGDNGWIRFPAALGRIRPAAKDAFPALSNTFRDDDPYVHVRAAVGTRKRGGFTTGEAPRGRDRLSRRMALKSNRGP